LSAVPHWIPPPVSCAAWDSGRRPGCRATFMKSESFEKPELDLEKEKRPPFMTRPRIVETDQGIQGAFNVESYDAMQRYLRDKGWIETDAIIKSGISTGKALEICPGPGYLGLKWLKKTAGFTACSSRAAVSSSAICGGTSLSQSGGFFISIPGPDQSVPAFLHRSAQVTRPAKSKVFWNTRPLPEPKSVRIRSVINSRGGNSENRNHPVPANRGCLPREHGLRLRPGWERSLRRTRECGDGGIFILRRMSGQAGRSTRETHDRSRRGDHFPRFVHSEGQPLSISMPEFCGNA